MPKEKIQFDIDREKRIGLPEAVFCESKSQEALVSLFTRFATAKEKPILFTRLSAIVFTSLPEKLQKAYDYDALSRTAWAKKCKAHKKGSVAIVSAGTADGFISHEVARTIEYLGFTPKLFEDCGVAGLWRIQKNLPAINTCDVIVVVAGLDAALASVLGGLTSKPIFAVPTSVGYGVAQGGASALSSMLSSCAPGIGVLNIDNGYGAACATARVLMAMGY